MKSLYEEYGEVLLQAFISSIIFSLFISFFLTALLNTNVGFIKEEFSPLQLSLDADIVSIKEFGVYDALIKVNEEYDYKDKVWAFNSNGEDIKSYISILNYSDLDTSVEGEKELTYVLRYNGEVRAVKGKLVIVDEKEELCA